MSIRFVHAADLHLDSPFLGIGSSAPEPVVQILRDATFEAYEAIIDLCIRERVDALLVAGDIYDGADRSLRAQRRFVAGLDRLHAAGIRSFICHGNHDPLDGWEANLAMPESCHRFGPEIEGVPFDPNNPDRGMVYGMSYPTQKVLHNVARAFKRDQATGLAIGLLHCNVGTNTGHEPYAPCSIEDLTESGMDYWALGHVHTRQVLRQHAPAIAYPGNPQGRHPNETGARGVFLVSIEDDGRATIEKRSTDVVRFATIAIDIAGLAGLQELLDRIEQGVGDAMGQSNGRHLLYRLKLIGQGSLHNELLRARVIEDIRADRNQHLGDPFAWCGKIERETRPNFDRESAKRSVDFLGTVLTIADEAREDPALQQDLVSGLDVFYSHPGARKYLQDFVPAGSELESLIADAELRIADYLSTEALV